MVEQEAYWDASAWELMVAVAWEQMEALWAGLEREKLVLAVPN